MPTPPDPMLPDPMLTDRERRFVDEYLLDLNQAGAARRAGYSAAWSKSLGSRLMARPHVRAAIERAMAARSARTRVDQDAVVQALAAVAFCDPRVLFDGAGALVPLDTLPDDKAAMLAGVDFVPRGGSGGSGVKTDGAAYVARLRPADRLKALELLGRHLGMFDHGPGGGSSGRRAPARGEGTHPGFDVTYVDEVTYVDSEGNPC